MGHNRYVTSEGDPGLATVTSITPAPSDLELDGALADAIELARSAAIDEAGAELVGEHVGVIADAERVATHLFTCLSPGYRGWHWAVTVARAPQGSATVNDVVLLPGDDALVAPPWVPWSERVRPGDLGVGDVLPTLPGDARLVAGLTGEAELEGASSLTPLGFGSWELGLGRERVLSPLGRDEAAERWLDAMGPDAPLAKAAPLTCASCGFLMTMGGALGQLFGVCANLMSPADGHVVAMTFGCGAHSEAQVEEPVAVVHDAIVVAEDDIVAVDLDAIPDPEPVVVPDIVSDVVPDAVPDAVPDVVETDDDQSD